MTTKLSSLFLVFGLILGAAFLSAGSASAQTATFPAGCSSALGYSVTTGAPCNGTSTATIGFLPGCPTALGYSTVNGAPCSGGSVAIFYLAGCSSIYGYSTITGAPCNGTTSVSLPPVDPGTPGLPTTGAGGEAGKNLAFLLAAVTVAGFGVSQLARKVNA